MEKDRMTLPVPSVVDITSKLNVLNKKFQGHGQLVSVAYDDEHRSVRYNTCVMESPAFPDKLLTNFSTCKALMDSGTPLKLEEFNRRFADF